VDGRIGKMKTEQEVKAEIAKIKRTYHPVLAGSRSTLETNTPRALMQIIAEEKLKSLNWVIGREFKSRLKGVE
jgi:hypothetical protein